MDITQDDVLKIASSRLWIISSYQFSPGDGSTLTLKGLPFEWDGPMFRLARVNGYAQGVSFETINETETQGDQGEISLDRPEADAGGQTSA
jgi:hypothetical protein